MYDYAPGKVDWLAHALPAEGTHAELPTAGTLARQDAATCPLDTTASDALAAIADSPFGYALVVSDGGVVLGRVKRSALEPLAGNDPIEPVLEPKPQTIRPHLTLAELRGKFERHDLPTLVVTRPDGTLVGVARRADVAE